MRGLFSINTSPLDNPLCISRSKEPLKKEELKGYPVVCRDCYSTNLFKTRKTNDACGRRNADELNSQIIETSKWPIVLSEDFPYGRIEAFGDTKSWIQQANYFLMAMRNPSIQYGDWTKNPGFISECIKHGYVVPANVEIVLSSLHENMPDDPSLFPFVNKVFTVYSLDWLIENKKDSSFINCGGRSCLKCGKCYLPVNKDDRSIRIINGKAVLFVNELRKQDQKRAERLGWVID